MIHDLNVLRDLWRTWIINLYLWFHHSILRDFWDVSSPEDFLNWKYQMWQVTDFSLASYRNRLFKFTRFACLMWIGSTLSLSSMSWEVKGQWSETSKLPRQTAWQGRVRLVRWGSSVSYFMWTRSLWDRLIFLERNEFPDSEAEYPIADNDEEDSLDDLDFLRAVTTRSRWMVRVIQQEWFR